MKKVLYLLFAAAITATAAVSCINTPDINEEEEEGQDTVIEESGLKPGTYKFAVSALKGTWKAGDMVYVKGGTGATAETITLKDSDISADGKTASVKLDAVTTDYLKPDGLYAAYPDDAVKHSYGILSVRTTFEKCDQLLSVAYLKDDTFSFKDVSSAFDFTVSGYDGYALAAGDREGHTITKAEVEYSSAKNRITPKSNTGYPFIYGDLVSGSSTRVLFVGDTTLGGGYTIYLSKNGKWCGTYTYEKDVTIKAGEVLDLGDITGKVSAYDGPAPKMPQVIKSTKFAVKFNELSGICLSADEDFLWGIDDDGKLGKISFEGELLHSYYVGSDPEEVSLNYDTKDLLIAIEPKGVGRLTPSDYNNDKRYTKIFSIPGTDISDENAGMEGLTYYKDGKVFVGTQTNSHLYLCDIATGNVIWDKILYNKNQVSEIAGLYFDPLTNWLWIIDSENKKIFVFDEEVTNLLGTYSVSDVANPESLCVDHKHGCVWVGDDYGSTSYLYRYDFEGLDDFNIQ